MKNTFLFSVMMILLVSSCSQIVEPPLSSAPQELVVLAEMEVGTFRPTLSLNSTFNDQLNELEIDELVEVSVYKNDDPIVNTFRLEDGFWTAPASLEIEEGNDYRLSIDATEFGVDIVEARTTVPVSGNLNVLTLSSPEVVTTTKGKETQFSTSFRVSTNSENSEYYHITPFVVFKNGDRKELTINKINSAYNAVIDIEHRHGILIDESVLGDSNEISLLMSLSQEIEISDFETPEMFFELRTVPHDYFLYHRSVSLQSQSSSSPFTLPTLTYTNFSSGYGLFSAFASKMETVTFN